MSGESATLTRAGAKQAKVPAKHSVQVSAAQHASSQRREFTAPGPTAVPKSFGGIPTLAPGEKNVGTPLVPSSPLLRLQSNLAMGAVNDPLEAEADAVADRVMRGQFVPPAIHSRSPAVRRKCTCEGSGKPCSSCEREEKKKLMRKLTGVVAPTEAPPIVHQVLNSPGQPLDASTRAFFEPRFGANFSHVRVHQDGQAAESARAIHALAYATGHHIVLGSNANSGPTSLMAHELAHVVQQSAGVKGLLQRADDAKVPTVTIPPTPRVGTEHTGRPFKLSRCNMLFLGQTCSDLETTEPSHVQSRDLGLIDDDVYVFGCTDEVCMFHHIVSPERTEIKDAWIIADRKSGFACGDEVTVCAGERHTQAVVKDLRDSHIHLVSKKVATALGQPMGQQFRGIAIQNNLDPRRFDCCSSEPPMQQPGDFPESKSDQKLV